MAKLLEVAAIEFRRTASFTLVLPKAVESDFWEPVGSPPKGALAPRDVGAAIAAALQREPEAELRVG